MLCQKPLVRTVIRNQQQLLLSPQQRRMLRQPTSAKILLQTRQRLTSVATLYSSVSPSSLRRASSKQFPCTAEPLTTDPCSFAAVTQFSIQLNFSVKLSSCTADYRFLKSLGVDHQLTSCHRSHFQPFDCFECTHDFCSTQPTSDHLVPCGHPLRSSLQPPRHTSSRTILLRT